MRRTAPAFLFVALVACGARADYTLDQAVYAKFFFFKDYVLYAQAEGNTLRFAPTPEALKDATPITGVPWENGILFKDAAIPLPPEAVPEGLTATGQFFFAPARVRDEAGNDRVIPWTHGKVWFSRTDEHGVKWTCVFRAGAGVDKNMVSDIDNAPEVRADLSQGLKLEVTAFPLNGSLRTGLRLMCGDVQLENLLRDGKPAPLGFELIGPYDLKMASKTGTLRDFAVSSDGIPYSSMRLPAVGDYVCKAVMDGGAMGRIEAEQKVTVSNTRPDRFLIAEAVYGKLVLFKDTALYALAEGDTMRFAATLDGLNDAPAVRGRSGGNGITFDIAALPVSDDALPEGYTGAGCSFFFHVRRVVRKPDGGYSFIPGARATLWLSRRDARNVTWDYRFRSEGHMSLDPDNPPEMRVVLPEELDLDIASTTADSNIYIGLRLAGGGLAMEGILRDGTPAPVEVTLLGPDGIEVASKTGTLADFGFT